MKSELFVIFVVFATLAHQGFCSKLSPEDLSFLSPDAVSHLNQMSTNQELTLKSGTESFSAVFKMIRDLATEEITGLTMPADYNASEKSAKSLSQVDDAIDYTLNTVLIVSGKTACDEVEEARTTCYRDWKNVYANLTETLDFVRSSDLSDAASEKLDDYKTLIRTGIKDTVKAITNSVRICAGISSNDVLKVIKTFESRMYLAIDKEIDHLFNAIRYYWYVITTKSSDMRYVYMIDEEMRRGDVAYKALVENGYSMLKTIYVNSYLDENGIIDDLAEIQLSNAIATRSFNSTIQILFAPIDDHLIEDSIGVLSSGTADKTAADKASAKWKAGTLQILKSIESTLGAEQEVFKRIDEIVSGFWSQYKTAKNASSSSDAISRIEAFGDKNDAVGEKYTRAIFELITRGKKFTCKVKSAIKALESRATKQFNVITGGFTEAYSILAEVLSGRSNSVLSESLDYLGGIKSRVVSATGNLANTIYAAQMNALIPEQNKKETNE